MHLTLPKHDILIIILKHSDQCFHSIWWIHRPKYLKKEHNNKVPIYIAYLKQYFYLK